MLLDEHTTHFVIVITMAKAKKVKAKPARKTKPVIKKATKPAKAAARKAKPGGKTAKPQRKVAQKRAKATTVTRKTATPRPPVKPTPAAPVTKPTSAAVAEPWREHLRAAVAATGPDFAAYLRGLGAGGWEHADTPELAGLEQWGTQLASSDRMAGIGALVRTAQHGFPLAVASGGIGLDGMGFHASEASMDGAPVETQIAVAAAWLDAPDHAHLAAVSQANDPSRQLQAWDEDLLPSDDRAHWWYVDVGQCCGYAITRAKGSASGHSYYEWPPEVCVGRGLVVAVRGLRGKGASLDAILAGVRAALVA